MKFLLATCADAASVDATSNRLSLFNVFEEMQSAQFPIALPYLTFVLLVEKTDTEPDEINLRLKGTLNRLEIFDFPLSASFQGKKRLRAIATLQGIPIEAPGTLTITAEHKKKPVGAWSIQISSVGTPSISQKKGAEESDVATSQMKVEKSSHRKVTSKKSKRTSKAVPARKQAARKITSKTSSSSKRPKVASAKKTKRPPRRS